MSIQNMQIENEDIKEKFNIELKWASYFFIYSLFLGFIFSFFEGLIPNLAQEINNVLLVLNMFILLYCSHKCLQEKKNIGNIFDFSIVNIIFYIFLGRYIFYSLLFYSSAEPFIIPNRKLEVIEGKMEINEINSNLFCDFINCIKNKF